MSVNVCLQRSEIKKHFQLIVEYIGVIASSTNIKRNEKGSSLSTIKK